MLAAAKMAISTEERLQLATIDPELDDVSLQHSHE